MLGEGTPKLPLTLEGHPQSSFFLEDADGDLVSVRDHGAFLVRVVNAHAELVAALRGIVFAVEYSGELDEAERAAFVLCIARAALAKAEPGSNDKGMCSVCRRPQLNGWHTHACE